MRYLALLISYSILLLSCNSRKQEVTSTEDQTKPDTVVTSESLQDPKISTTPQAPDRPFQNQVFLIGRDVDFVQDDCEIYTGCEGCSSELIFLTLDRFAFVSSEMEEITYFSGHYTVDSTKLILTYDRQYITEFMNEELEEKEGDLGFKYFQIDHCQGKIHLLDKSNANATHGIRFKPDDEKKSMQALLDSKAWKVLNP
ncbi:MAG: hypothetical protein JNL40_03040 [Cyclobacteriaceae bacterium]|nr:hypothetical protein [Cyclobacteriaceae bacterium]